MVLHLSGHIFGMATTAQHDILWMARDSKAKLLSCVGRPSRRRLSRSGPLGQGPHRECQTRTNTSPGLRTKAPTKDSTKATATATTAISRTRAKEIFSNAKDLEFHYDLRNEEDGEANFEHLWDSLLALMLLMLIQMLDGQTVWTPCSCIIEEIMQICTDACR